jgi:hypothetical protein
MAKRKKVLTPEQEALLNQFQNNNNDNKENNNLNENNNVKASSAGFKPMINRSGARGK